MRRRHRAIALVLTLLVTGILLMLVTVFFGLNRDQIQLRRSGDKSLRAQAAALSGLEYARMRLEADTQWGIPGAGCDRIIKSGGLNIYEDDSFSSSGVDTFCCVGVLEDGQSHFQINLVAPNGGTALKNLSGARANDQSIAGNPEGGLAAWGRETLPGLETSVNYLNASNSFYPPVISPVVGLGPLRTVTAKSCMLQIRGYYQGAVKICDVSLTIEKPTDAVLAAGGHMTVDLDTRNGGRWSVHTLDPANERVQATGDITIHSPSTDNLGMLFTSASLNRSITSAKEIMSSSSRISSVADLQDGCLKVYGVSGSPVDASEAGDNANARVRPSSGVPSVADFTAATMESQLKSTTSVPIALPGGNYTFKDANTLLTPDGSKFKNIVVNNTVLAKVENFQLIFSENTSVEFTGLTNFSSMGNQPPSVLLGYNINGIKNTSAFLPTKSSGTFLKVTNGTLNVDGSVSGKGSVIATGNSTTAGDVIMHGRSQLSADPDAGVTIFAERNIKVAPPDLASASFFSNDLTPIALGLQAYARNHKLNRNDWNKGKKPLNEFANLGDDQDDLTQGGRSSVSDSLIDNSMIKTALVCNSSDQDTLSDIKSALTKNFPVVDQSEEAAAEFESMCTAFVEQEPDPGLSVGRYLRLREFLRDLQSAYDAKLPLPKAFDSPWGDLQAQNAVINGKLKAELSFFNRKGKSMMNSFDNLIYDNSSKNPSNNCLTKVMNARDAKWTGFLYARGSILIDSGGGDLDILGSMITRNDMVIADVGNVTTIYAPEYLKSTSVFKSGNRLMQRLWCDFYRIR